MTRYTAADVAKIQKRQGKKITPLPAPPKKKHKFSAQPTTVDDIKFGSLLEASRYKELKLLCMGGKVKWFIRQPMFDLPGGVTCRADFLIVWSGGLAMDSEVTVEDCTGMDTEQKDRNYKMVRALYGIDVAIVR